MGDEESVSQQPPADEEQDQTQQDQTTGEPGTDEEEPDKPGTTDTPGEITPESHYPGG
jgi:hypothetical protein